MHKYTPFININNYVLAINITHSCTNIIVNFFTCMKMQWYKHKITPLNKKVETWETNSKCVWTSQCKICLGKRHYHKVDRSENANYYCVYTATRNRARIVLCWKLHHTGHTGGASLGTPCICYSTKTQREPPRRHCYITTTLSLHHFWTFQSKSGIAWPFSLCYHRCSKP